MENTLSLLGTKLYEDGLHKCFLIKWKAIEPLCKKWSRNRNVDNERVKEMMEYYKAGGYIPRIIHLAELEAEGLACYDGNHRREVFSLLISPALLMSYLARIKRRYTTRSTISINQFNYRLFTLKTALMISVMKSLI